VLTARATDRTGRIVASHLTSLIIRGDVPIGRLIETWIGGGHDPSLAEWTRNTREIHESFWATWLAREARISRELQKATATDRQPGLFDRRAEQDLARDVTNLAERFDELRARVEWAEQARALDFGPSTLALLLHA
jgi:hypothetical protein